MAKKKNTVALFEVISKSKAENIEPDMSVPGWMRAPSAKGEAEPASKAPAANRVKAPGSEAVFSKAGGRLRLSLNYVSCLVVAFGLVVLASLSFWLGRATAEHEDQAIQANMRADLDGERAEREEPDRPRTRQAGKYYMVIQMLPDDSPGSEQEAIRIADWCSHPDNGEPATVNRYDLRGQSRILVWSLKPFDKTDAKSIENHALLVEELGRRYFGKYGTYDFRQRHEGKLDPMMLPYYKPAE